MSQASIAWNAIKNLISVVPGTQGTVLGVDATMNGAKATDTTWNFLDKDGYVMKVCNFVTCADGGLVGEFLSIDGDKGWGSENTGFLGELPGLEQLGELENSLGEFVCKGEFNFDLGGDDEEISTETPTNIKEEGCATVPNN